MTRMLARAWSRCRVGVFTAACVVPVLLGCSSAGEFDSGFGAGEPVPPTKNCQDFCARNAECIVALCDEDTSSTSYMAIHDKIDSACVASCTDAQLQATATDPSWQCYFQSSCRQVFAHDVCMANARYTCS
jgi:hypothetical protein